MKDLAEGENSGSRFSIRNWSGGKLLSATLISICAILLLIRLQKILILFYLALLFGLAINSFILHLERRRVSRPLAVAGLALIFLTGVVVAGFWIAPPAIAQAQNLANNYPEYLSRAQGWMHGALSRYPEFRERIQSETTQLPSISNQAGSILKLIQNFAVGLGGLIFSGFLLFFLIVFGLMNPKPMASAIFDLTPPDYHDRIENTMKGIQDKVVAWAGGTLILMAIVGVVAYVGLYLIGVPQALLFGIIAAVGEGIPTIGPILSAIPPIAVMLLTDPVKALFVVGLFVVIQLLENSVIVPMVMGNRLNVHPWGLIFLILVMGELFGVAGVFLATPTAAILSVIYDEMIPKPGRVHSSVPSAHRVGRAIGGMPGELNDSC